MEWESASCLTGETFIRAAPHLCETSGGVSTCSEARRAGDEISADSDTAAKASVPQKRMSYGAAAGMLVEVL